MTEYLPICTVEDPQAFAINPILQALTIKRQYNLHNKGRTKFLDQSIGITIEGHVSNKFEEAKQGLRFDAQNVNTNKMHFNTMIHTFLMKSSPEDTLKEQKEYLESARCPFDMTPENYIKWIMHINKCLLLYEVGATNQSNKKADQKDHCSKSSQLNLNQIHFKMRQSRNRFGQGQESHQHLCKDSCSSKRI